MAKKQILRLISPKLDKEVLKLINTIKTSLGRQIGYKQGTKVFAVIYSHKPKLDLTAEKLNEILGSPDEDEYVEGKTLKK